jgi:hypothetical protein
VDKPPLLITAAVQPPAAVMGFCARPLLRVVNGEKSIWAAARLKNPANENPLAGCSLAPALLFQRSQELIPFPPKTRLPVQRPIHRLEVLAFQPPCSVSDKGLVFGFIDLPDRLGFLISYVLHFDFLS